MKKTLKLALTTMMVVMAGACVTACGTKTATESTTAGTTAAQTTTAAETTEAATTAIETITGKVATDGSTSMEKVIGALGESFVEINPQVDFTYNPTGSGSGITAVSSETCDIGLASRALKDDEKASGLTETTLAIDGIAIIVNNANAVADLTLDEVASIYKGEITNWSEVGGTDAEIVVIGREAGSGTRDGFESITNTKDACALRQELTSTGDVIATVKSNENAIGYASLASVSSDITVVAVNGVVPSAETILDGSYAIQRPFMLITKDGKELSPAAAAFMDYALSDEAKTVVEAAGVVPAAGK